MIGGALSATARAAHLAWPAAAKVSTLAAIFFALGTSIPGRPVPPAARRPGGLEPKRLPLLGVEVTDPLVDGGHLRLPRRPSGVQDYGVDHTELHPGQLARGRRPASLARLIQFLR